jgi:hypothetical protein
MSQSSPILPPTPDSTAPTEDKGSQVLVKFVGIALCLHLLFAFGGGKYLVPWFLALTERPVPKKKEPPKETVDVEMVEAVVAKPPPPNIPPPPEPPPQTPPDPPPTPQVNQPSDPLAQTQ